MNFTQALSSLLGLGVAAGLNLYAAILTVGLAQRFGWITGLPQGLEVLSNEFVLIAAGVMYLAEFVADKVPGFTPIWDGIHTFIRPVGGALLAFGAAGNLDPKLQVLAMILGGSVALGTHATKMGTRLVAHSVPDPVTHSAISVAEDFGAVGLLLLAFSYPAIALPLLVAIVVAIGFALPFLFRVLRFFLRTLGGRLLSWTNPDIESEIPKWARSPEGRTVKAFVRSGKGLQRFSQVYLNYGGARAVLRGKGFFGEKSVDLEAPGEHVQGLFLDTIALRKVNGEPVTVYLTKDWGDYYRRKRTFSNAAVINA